MAKKKTVRIERIGGITKLHNTCASKSHFYKIDLGGKWDPAEKCWTLAECACSDAELQAKCDAAPYNTNSTAAYWQRRKAEEVHYAKTKAEYDALMEKWERGEVPCDEKSDWARENGDTATRYSRPGDFKKGVLIRDFGQVPSYGRDIALGYVIGKKEAVLDTMHHAKLVDAHCIVFKGNNAFLAYPDVVFDLPDGRAMSHYKVDYE